MIRYALIAVAAIALAAPSRAATDIVEVTSPGGITAWLVEEPSIPIIAIEVGFSGGSTLDPVGKEGVGAFAVGLLEEGAGDLDAAAFARRGEELAARFGFSSGRDGASLSAQMLVETRDATVDLLRLALTQPRFDADAVERVRAQMLSGVRSNATDPNAIAGETFARLAFPDDPYGRPDGGTEASLTAMTVEDLRAQHRALFVRGRAKIGVVGAITPAELGPLLDRLLGDLPADGPAVPPVATPALTGGVTVVDFDTPQSVVAFGQRGIDRHDPDFFPAYVLNHILGGGGFSSRLTTEVREKRGLTYGVYAYLADYQRADLWMGGVASANDRVGEAIAVIQAEWRRMAEAGATDAELDAAKRFLTGAYPLRFDSNRAIAGILVGVQEDGLGIDYIARRNDLVNAVTAADVGRVARTLMDPDGLRFVVVGRPAGVEPTN